MPTGRRQGSVLAVPGGGRFAGTVIAVGMFHLAAWAAVWTGIRSDHTVLAAGAVFVVIYLVVAWRIASRRAILGADELVAVGMWRSHIPRADLHGVVLEKRGGLRAGTATVIVGLDRTGLGRPLWTIRGAKDHELAAFADALNKWCGRDPKKARAETEQRNIAVMNTALHNLDEALKHRREPTG
jgi:hypothetical protein